MEGIILVKDLVLGHSPFLLSNVRESDQGIFLRITFLKKFVHFDTFPHLNCFQVYDILAQNLNLLVGIESMHQQQS